MKQSRFIKRLTKTGSGYALYIPIEYIKEYGGTLQFDMQVGIEGDIHLTPLNKEKPDGRREEIRSSKTI